MRGRGNKCWERKGGNVYEGSKDGDERHVHGYAGCYYMRRRL
jgi:hypothetical protein